MKRKIARQLNPRANSLPAFMFLLSAVLINCFPAVSSATWTVEKVDKHRIFEDFGPRSIALDRTTSYPHIVYGGDHLYYAYYDGSIWHLETVDNAEGVGRSASIALDANNKVHISYYDYKNGDLKYATNSSGTWVISFIDISGDVGGYNCIAIDSNNKVHISYYDYDKGFLKYATNASGDWITSNIDDFSADAGRYN
ncbi:MAG: hypothetical protein N2246_11715, partial [Candidatus Sumerlaeia bacterium]|nr:hypothetical protein [Candidatus Sumerlaeia bacterium]